MPNEGILGHKVLPIARYIGLVAELGHARV
jgi:hypothetical protein